MAACGKWRQTPWPRFVTLVALNHWLPPSRIGTSLCVWLPLMRLGGPEMPPPSSRLIAVLKDDDYHLPKAATLALVTIGAPAVGPLIAALDVGNNRRREAAGEALVRIGAPAVEPLITALHCGEYYRCEAAEGTLVRIGTIAVEPLIAALKDSNSVVRGVVAKVLGKIRDARAVVPLIAALEDGNGDVRLAISRALGGIADARSVKPLIAALKDSEHTVRWAAAESLFNIGTPAVESLNAALKDRDRHARVAAASTLEKIGNARAVMPLIAALKDEDRGVRLAAAAALNKVGDARALEALVAALADDDSRVCMTAAHALNRMGWQPGQNASGAAYRVARQEWEKCAELGILAVKPLIAALADKDSNVREGAAGALDKIGWRPSRDEGSAWYWIAKQDWSRCSQIGAPAAKPLISVLDEWFTIRKAAAEVLVKLYHSGLLNEAEKRLILAERNRIIEPHTVVDSANDDERTGPRHIGIGVAFPI